MDAELSGLRNVIIIAITPIINLGHMNHRVTGAITLCKSCLIRGLVPGFHDAPSLPSVPSVLADHYLLQGNRSQHILMISDNAAQTF